MVLKDHVAEAQKYLTTKTAGDSHLNGIFLGADIHKCFDDYQWGIYVRNCLT